jgi:hypothetical protein
VDANTTLSMSTFKVDADNPIFLFLFFIRVLAPTLVDTDKLLSVSTLKVDTDNSIYSFLFFIRVLR